MPFWRLSVTTKLIIKKYIFVIIPLIIILLGGLVILKDFLKPQAPMVRPPARVTILDMKLTPVKNSYEVIGFLEADQSVDLVARVTGFLEEKSFTAGDKVKQGDVLFRIDPKAYQAALDAAKGALMSAQAQLTQATLSFNRISDLYAKRSAPKSDYDNAKAALDVAQASVLSAQGNLSQAELNLDWAEVKAPFDGEISDSPFSVGSYVGPTSGVLATLVVPDPMRVRFGVPDRLMADQRFGAATSNLPRGKLSEVETYLLINGNHRYEETGKISYVAPLVEAQTDTIQIKASFPNPNGQLVPGQVVTVILEDSSPRDVIMVPKNALMYTAEAGSFVYVLGKGKDQEGNPTQQDVAEQRMVTRGVEFPDGIEISQGLNVGDKVINLGLMSSGALIQPGTPVEVLQAQGEGDGQGQGQNQEQSQSQSQRQGEAKTQNQAKYLSQKPANSEANTQANTQAFLALLAIEKSQDHKTSPAAGKRSFQAAGWEDLRGNSFFYPVQSALSPIHAALSLNQAAFSLNQSAFSLNQAALTLNQSALSFDQSALSLKQPFFSLTQAVLSLRQANGGICCSEKLVYSECLMLNSSENMLMASNEFKGFFLDRLTLMYPVMAYSLYPEIAFIGALETSQARSMELVASLDRDSLFTAGMEIPLGDFYLEGSGKNDI
jgi:membrane fusion protein (multidrug efflux system)